MHALGSEKRPPLTAWHFGRTKSRFATLSRLHRAVGYGIASSRRVRSFSCASGVGQMAGITHLRRPVICALSVHFRDQSERLYMDPSSFASTPFFGGEVRLLTYIRPLTAASI